MASKARDERRKAAREAARKRAEEIDALLEEAPLPRMEPPPAGRVVESTPTVGPAGAASADGDEKEDDEG